MDSWQVDFVYKDKRIDCNLSLTGNARAVALGLGVATLTLEAPIQSVIKSGSAPPALVSEAMLLIEIRKGNISSYKGTYLTVKKLRKKIQGLQTSISVEWSD